MEKTRSHWMVALFLAGGVWLFSSDSARASASFSIQLPSYSTDFSDLDVRDSQNRKITSPAKRNELRRLFESGLSGLLLNNLTPSKRSMQLVLSHSWKLSFGWLQKAAAPILTSLIGWISKNKWTQLFVWSRSHTPIALRVAGTLTPARVSFHSLIPTLLSSTTLLR